MIGDGRIGGGDSDLHRRIPWLAAFVALVFLIFFGRLFQLQVVDTDDLRLRSVRNSVRTLRLEAPRGDILDRDGRILASTRPAFGVQVMPNDLRERETVLPALAHLLELEPAEVIEKVGTPRGRRRFQPVRIADDLSYEELARVESHLYALPGVVVDLRPRRDYVAGDAAAHLIGFIGEVQGRQLESERYADYRQGEVIGQSGVESLEQEALRGRAGGLNQIVNVAGRVVGELDKVDPVPGGSVQLTLDLDLQHVAEAAFLPDVLGERPRIGALVALDVHTGDVLAMVSKPSFDPNDFAGGIDAAIWEGLTGDHWKPMQNRAISGQYPPGSTYKAFVAAAGLEEKAIAISKKVFCPGYTRLHRRTYRCWKRGGHGWVDMYRSLVESCDVYFYLLGKELGVDTLAKYANGFHLGKTTGIPLPQEMPGLVPTRAWKERRFKEAWVPGETLSTAIGQGFNLATPLQLAVSYAAIANGGTLVRPRIVLRVADAEGRLVDGPPPERIGRVPVAPEHLAIVREALEGVVEGRGGTGGRVRVPGVRVAGKTGTAQVVSLEHSEGLEEDEIRFTHRDHAWFVGFAPADAPEIVVSAIIEHGGHGSSAAGPVVQKVLARYFEKKAVQRVPAEVAWGGARVLRIDRRSLQNFDWALLGLITALATIGLVNLASATAAPEGLSEELRRQLFSLGIGASVAVVLTVLDYRHWERLAMPAFAIGVAALVATLVFATVTRGSQSWLFGGRVQPSELAKVALVLALARWFQRHPPGQTTRLRDLVWPGAIIALPVGLIVAQRDMGVALLTLLIGSTYFFFVRIPWRAWVAVGVAGLAALAALWSFGLAPYQKERVLGVIDPGRDPLASGYQATQSRIAVGSGGLFGTGYREGTQTQLRFLPTQHTDFAFSVLAEEWGFVGSVVTLSLYAMLLVWGLVVARDSKDDFGALIAIGVVGCLFWPAVLNVAMVLGLAPVIGVPLPLFSYGGSALVVTLALLGLLMNVSMRRYVF